MVYKKVTYSKLKYCIRCSQLYMLTGYYQKVCEGCRGRYIKERNRKYATRYSKKTYLKHREKILKRNKRWRDNNTEKIREYKARVYKRDKDKIAKRDKDYYLKNRKKISERQKKYNQRPEVKERMKIRNRERYIKNKDKIINDWREWKKKNPKKTRAQARRYRAKPKTKRLIKSYKHKRKSLEWSKVGDVTEIQIKQIYERDKVCVYCGSDTRLELDHIIPLTHIRGNSTFYNYVLACKSCNTSKNYRNVFEWCTQKGIDVPDIVIECLNKQIKGLEVQTSLLGAV